MRLGIIGGGVVGQATARAYLEHVEEVCIYDVNEKRATHSFNTTLHCDITFICLPTPQKEGSLECDISTIEELCKCVSGQDYNLVLRSTVPIGTTRKLSERYKIPNLVHSPEFLTARCAMVDAQIPSRNIIGRIGDKYNIAQLWDLYRRRFSHVPILVMSSDESESVKLFLNGFFATKVAYWNEMRTLSDKLCLNWGSVMAGVLSDGRVHSSHTQVPGPDGKYGFGGSCLPKDLASLVYQMLDVNDANVYPWICNAVHERNKIEREELGKSCIK